MISLVCIALLMTVVPALAAPDMSVGSVATNCGYLFGNESNEISATITNSGTDCEGSFEVSFVLSDGFNTTESIDALAAGANTTVSINDPTIRDAGDGVTITVTADCYGAIAENDESNNGTTLDTTVVNNGYKGKTYTGGENMTTWKTYDLNGDLVYSAGDSYYLSGYYGWPSALYTANWIAGNMPVPASASIKEVRLYVPYCFDYQGDMPGNISLNFNGAVQTIEKHYTDRKGHGSYDNPYGMLAYNVTADFDTNGNTANLTNSNPKCCEQKTASIRGMMLVVVYEDANEPRRQIFVNEEFDILNGKSSYCTTPDEATAWAPITGLTIDPSTIVSARLVTFAPGADPTEGELIFNGHVWTDEWNDNGVHQIGISDRYVTAHLRSTGNVVGFQSSADSMEASNAILIVEEGDSWADSDSDGVPDYWDDELDTPPGYLTDSEGIGYHIGDVNRDGELTSVDAMMILQAIVKNIEL
ncbi:MAG: DUF3344 domain-containing protein [Euryarchaeota archaeon]|nr:DUF3344 domain-containing protein [Euryarchaeota archaeon]